MATFKQRHEAFKDITKEHNPFETSMSHEYEDYLSCYTLSDKCDRLAFMYALWAFVSLVCTIVIILEGSLLGILTLIIVGIFAFNSYAEYGETESYKRRADWFRNAYTKFLIEN